MATKYKHTEIGKVNVHEGTFIKVSLVNDESVDLRMWMDTDTYKGPTKRGIRFQLDGNWEEFKSLISKVDKIYKEIA